MNESYNPEANSPTSPEMILNKYQHLLNEFDSLIPNKGSIEQGALVTIYYALFSFVHALAQADFKNRRESIFDRFASLMMRSSAVGRRHLSDFEDLQSVANFRNSAAAKKLLFMPRSNYGEESVFETLQTIAKTCLTSNKNDEIDDRAWRLLKKAAEIRKSNFDLSEQFMDDVAQLREDNAI